MFHLAGWTQSQDSAVLVPTAGLADQSLQVNGNDIIVPNDLNMLIAAYGLGPNATRVSLQAPSLRAIFNQEVYGLDVNAVATDQLLLEYYGSNAIQLAAGEPLEAWMAESNAAASRVTTLVWLCDTPPTPLNADIRTIRVTSANAAVANAWTNIVLTFNDVLPSGTYALMGMQLQSANMQAFRCVFKGGMYRPGALGQTAISTRQNQIFRHGGMGIWGTFENLTPPSIDVLCNGADAAFAGVMDLAYLGR